MDAGGVSKTAGRVCSAAGKNLPWTREDVLWTREDLRWTREDVLRSREDFRVVGEAVGKIGGNKKRTKVVLAHLDDVNHKIPILGGNAVALGHDRVDHGARPRGVPAVHYYTRPLAREDRGDARADPRRRTRDERPLP
jgi:hypothetical protein